jgi:hypothetical protein
MKNPTQTIRYFQHEIVVYETFVKTSELLWEEELQRYENSLKEENFELLERFDYLSGSFSIMSIEYAQYQRKSHLVILLSLHEDFLNQLCISVKKQFKQLKKVENKKEPPSKIEKLANLLRDSAFGFPSNSEEFKNIKTAQLIRNAVIHSAGYLDDQKHIRQIEIVDANSFLKIEKYARNHLLLMPEYISELISDIKLFTEQLSLLAEKLPNTN